MNLIVIALLAILELLSMTIGVICTATLVIIMVPFTTVCLIVKFFLKD